jgi:hypothetical protein
MAQPRKTRVEVGTISRYHPGSSQRERGERQGRFFTGVIRDSRPLRREGEAGP